MTRNLFCKIVNTQKERENMEIRDFEQEIDRAYRVLGEQAEIQNDMDINEWFKNGTIGDFDRDYLKRYNRNLYKRMMTAAG